MGARSYIYLPCSCREGVCGSDGINVNGVNMLSCMTKVEDLGSDHLIIQPLPGMNVMRDLVTDVDDFFNKFITVKPYLIRTSPNPDKEIYQSPEDRKKNLTVFTSVSFVGAAHLHVLHTGLTRSISDQTLSLERGDTSLTQEMKVLWSVFQCLTTSTVYGDVTQFITVLKHVQRSLILPKLSLTLESFFSITKFNLSYS